MFNRYLNNHTTDQPAEKTAGNNPPTNYRVIPHNERYKVDFIPLIQCFRGKNTVENAQNHLKKELK